MPDDEFATFGGTALADNSTDSRDEFARFGGQITGVDDGSAYLKGLNSGQIPLPDSVDAHYKAAKGYFDSSGTAKLARATATGLFGTEGVDHTGQDVPLPQSLKGIPLVSGLAQNALNLGEGLGDKLQKVPVFSIVPNIATGIGNLANSAYQGIGAAKDELVDRYRQSVADTQSAQAKFNADYDKADAATRIQMENEGLPVDPTKPDLIGSVATAGATGLAKGVYGLAKPVVTGAGKLVDATAGDAMRLLGDSATPGRIAAEEDYARRVAERDYEAPANKYLTDLSGLPAVESVAENVAPFVAPVGVGLHAGEAAAKVGGLVGDVAEGATKAVAKTAPYAGGGIGFVSGGIGGAPLGPYGGIAGAATGAAGGAYTGAKIARVLTAAAPAVGEAVGQATGLGINAAAATGTGLLYGLAGSESGDEAEGVRSGSAIGAAFSPLAMLGGTFTRQRVAKAAENSRLIGRGQISYGTDPAFDAQHNAGMQVLSPENQALINANRGFLRDLSTPDAKQVQVYVQTPEDYAVGAEASNGGQVSDAGSTRGYYRGDNGKIFLNAGAVDIAGGLSEALGHEASHAGFQDALTKVDPKMATALTAAIRSKALVNEQPTPDFQRFINAYAKEPVDWNALPGDADKGLSKRYLLQELGAQTGAALRPTDDPASFTLKPEASDYIKDIFGDFARSVGLTKGPDISTALGGDLENPVYATPGLLRRARMAQRRLGQAVQAQADIPVRPSKPVTTTKRATGPATLSTGEVAPTVADTPIPATNAVGTVPRQEGQVSTPTARAEAGSSDLQPQTEQVETSENIGTAASSASSQSEPIVNHDLTGTDFRSTQAYQDTVAVAALPKKMGGLGLNLADARARADAAATNPDVPNTLDDYLFHAQTGRVRGAVIQTSPANPQPAVVPQPGAVDPTRASIVQQATPDVRVPAVDPVQQPVASALETSAVSPVSVEPNPSPKSTNGTDARPVPTDRPVPARPTAEPAVTAQAAPEAEVPQPAVTAEAQPEGLASRVGSDEPETTANGKRRYTLQLSRDGGKTFEEYDINATPQGLKEVVGKMKSEIQFQILSDHGIVYAKDYNGRNVDGLATHIDALQAADNPARMEDYLTQPISSSVTVEATNQPSRPEQNEERLSEANKDQFSADRMGETGLPPASLETVVPANAPQLPQVLNTNEPQNDRSLSDATTPPEQGQAALPPAAPIDLTADDIKRIEAETEKSFTYTGSKPNKKTLAANPNALAEREAAALAEAKRVAVLQAHKEALPEGDNRVQLRVDPDTERQSLSGARLVDGDPVHTPILNGLDDQTRTHLDAAEKAIASNQPLNFDYMSADTKDTGVTGAGRAEAQRRSTADDRAAGEGAVEEADKLFYPSNISVTPSGKVLAYGFSPDKLLGNATRVLSYFSDRGDKTVPYRVVNDARFIQDFRNYSENHANGWKGDGSKALVGTERIPVSVTEGYEPHLLDADKAKFLNLVTQGDEAKAKSSGPKGGIIREFARKNGLSPDAATNEVNALRAQIDARQDLRAPGDPEKVGTGETLESPWESVRVDLIRNLKPVTDAPASQTNLRAQAFNGDRRTLTSAGQPNARFAGAGFLPGRGDGRTPVTPGAAVPEDGLSLRHYSNATVTEAGVNFLPAYHATPHEVKRFTLDKVGTGEGVQAFGHGLYYSDAPEVSGVNGFYYNQFKDRFGTANSYKVDLDVQPDHLMDWNKSLADQSDYVKRKLGIPLVDTAKVSQLRQEQYDLFEKIGVREPTEAEIAYGTKLADDINDLERPQDDAIRVLSRKYSNGRFSGKASDFYEGIGMSLSDDARRAAKLTSAHLNRLGIPGIVYSVGDYQGNGDAAAKANNYVMFDDSKIKITHKNDVPVESSQPSGEFNPTDARINFLPSAGELPSNRGQNGDNNGDVFTRENAQTFAGKSYLARSRGVTGPLESASDYTAGDGRSIPTHDEPTATRAARAAAEEKALRAFAFDQYDDPRSYQLPTKQLGRGAEHEVYLTPGGKRVIKVTRKSDPANYGFGISLNNDGQGATAGEYLDRLRLQNDIFNDDVRLEHVIPAMGSTRVVTSQPAIKGDPATPKQVDAYMDAKGFNRLGPGMYYHPQAQILVHDLHARNAVMTPQGNVRAIDPAIMRATPEMADYIRQAAR